MKKYFFLFLISLKAYSQISQNDPGMSLLSAYSCKSVGTKSSEQLNAIKSLENVVQTVQNIDECKALTSQLASLPQIDSILDQMKMSAEEMAIRQQEEIINQALADLQAIDQAEKMKQDTSLYPSSERLRAQIVESRERLTELKAQQTFQKHVLSKQGYILGIGQLDNLATSLTNILQDPNSQCFQKAPMAYGNLTASLVGISGFFMSQPLGIATNLAGKVLQSVFTLASNSIASRRNTKTFNEINQINLVSGLSCAFESLANQRCKLEREYDIFKKLLEVENEENAAPYSLNNSDCLKTALILPEVTKNNLEKIVSWVRESNNIGFGVFGGENLQKKTQALNNYMTQSNALKNEFNKIEPNLKVFDNPATIKDKRIEAIFASTKSFTKIRASDLAVMESYSSKEVSAPFYGNEIAISAISNQEGSELFLKLIYPPGTPENKITDSFNQLRQEYVSAYLRQESASGSSLKAEDVAEVTAGTMYAYLTTKYSSKYGSLPNMSPVVKDITNTMMGDQSVTNVLVNIGSLDEKIKSSLANTIPEERLQGLILNFYGSSSDRNSPLQEIKNLRSFLSNVDQLPLNPSTKSLLDINSLTSKLDSIVSAAQAYKDRLSNQEKIAPSEWKEFIEQLNSMIGSSNNLATSVTNINKEIQRYVSEELNKKAKDKIDPDAYNDLLFYANKSVLESTVEISETPTSQMVDFETALSLSSAHISGLKKFFEDEIDDAMDLSDKNTNPLFKQKLCISLLSLPNISSSLAKRCKGIELKSASNNSSILFDNVVNQPMRVRACAYDNFLSEEKNRLSNKKKTAP